jgi:hypothetical protein
MRISVDTCGKRCAETSVRKGETEVVSLDKTAVENLVSVLKTILPYFDAVEATSISADVDTGQCR